MLTTPVNRDQYNIRDRPRTDAKCIGDHDENKFKLKLSLRFGTCRLATVQVITTATSTGLCSNLFPITHREGPYFGPGFGIRPAVLPSPSVAPAFQPSASPMSGSGPVGPAVQPSSELPDPSPDPVEVHKSYRSNI